MILTAELQVNPTKPHQPPVITAGRINATYAARAMRRMRRTTAAASLVSATIAQSDLEKIDERGGDSERGEDVCQPWLGPEQFVHSPAPDEAHADRDRKHPSDRGSFEELTPLAEFGVVAVIVRHG